MYSENTYEPANLIDWFDLESVGIYLTPELVCGRPCILMLDAALLFEKHNLINKGHIEDYNFKPVRFEASGKKSAHLYIYFTDTIESDFFYKNLGIPLGNIKSYKASLMDIQTVFYKHACDIFGFRIDVLVRSSVLLGSQDQNEVYSSMFGRYMVVRNNASQEFQYRDEPKERSPSFFRVSKTADILICCESFVKDAVRTRRNISIEDVIRFAAVLYQEKGKPLHIDRVKPHQIFTILNAFTLLFNQNILALTDEEFKNKDFFSNREYFRSLCLNAEACPSQPRGIYTDYLASQYSTPSPLAFIMQRLLIAGDPTSSWKSVLNPMFGYGALSVFLSKHGLKIEGIEISKKTFDLIKDANFENTRLHNMDYIDTPNEQLLELTYNRAPFKYVISSPACLISKSKYEYRDKHGSIELERTDLIALLKSLLIREYQGRTVFLLPYFMDQNIPFASDQDALYKKVFAFIDGRYEIEGICSISSEIYSKSLQKVRPILIVIGDRKENFSPTSKNLFSSVSHVISDYESLWDWATFICYKRSNIAVEDQNQFNLVADTIEDDYLDLPKSEALVSEKLSADDMDEMADYFEQKTVASSPAIAIKIQDSDAAFNLIKTDDVEAITTEAETSTQGEEGTIASENTSAELPLTDNVEEDSDPKSPLTSKTENSTEDKVETTAQTSDGDKETPVAKTDDKLPTDTPSPEKASESVASESTETKSKNTEPVLAPEQKNIAALPSFVNKEKIAKVRGNFFELNNRNKIIRYHSLASLSDPKSNVSLSNFSSYLIAKRKLDKGIHDILEQAAFAGSQDTIGTKFELYLKKYNLDVSIESFIGSLLELKSPKQFVSQYKSEHLDLLAACILRSLGDESVLVSDSLGMHPEISLASMIHYNQINGKATIYFARSKNSITKLTSAYDSLNNSVFGKKDTEFVYLHEHENHLNAIGKLTPNKVIVILNDPLLLLKLKNKSLTEKFSNIEKFATIFDTDLGPSKFNAGIITAALKAPTIFRSDRFISADTNLDVVSGLFSKDIMSRYFSPVSGKLDEMTCYLLKNNLIESLAYFERIEDLSNIGLKHKPRGDIWNGKYSILVHSYSATVNNIVVLAEDIQRNINQKNETKNQASVIRSMAMDIIELCSFCLISIPLTYSIFTAVRQQEKPVVAVPKNIEEILFSILEKMQVKLVIDLPEHGVLDLTSLNQLITLKLREYHELASLKTSNTNAGRLEKMRTDIDYFISIRSASIFKYLTFNKQGRISKCPDITSLIAAFFKYCTSNLTQLHPRYDDLSQKALAVSAEIEGLVDLPLCIIDFMRFELSQYRISSAELSTRSFHILPNEDTEEWEIGISTPLSDGLLLSQNNAIKIEKFNAGDLDVLFVEQSELVGFDLSSLNLEPVRVSDHARKRVLFLTYFNQPIKHYLSLIHSVNSPKQYVSPEIYFEVAETPAQKVMASLVARQLDLYNVPSNPSLIGNTDLSYYTTEPGKKLLQEYLAINPRFAEHNPTLRSQQWSLFDVLNVVSMLDISLQNNILDQLAYFAKQHLDFLKDTKANPFDIVALSPKAEYEVDKLPSDILYLNRKLNKKDQPFDKPLKRILLKYVKNTAQSFTIKDCELLFTQQAALEKTHLKHVLMSMYAESAIEDFGNLDELKHSELIDRYIQFYSSYLISMYRDKIIGMMQDRYRNWVFTNKICKLDAIRSIFQTTNGIRVGSTLNDVYQQILMLGSSALIAEFESSCRILTFLTSYQASIARQEKTAISPILLPVTSPFNDKTQKINEGILLRLNYPKSQMLSPSAKSYSITIAYPSKSKPIDLNLEYVLNQPEVLKNQSVLSKPGTSVINAVLNVYKNSKFKDILQMKLKNMLCEKPVEFTDLNKLNAVNSHPTVQAFNRKYSSAKIRTLEVFAGNLFEAYYFLRDRYPLTLSSFINDEGMTEYGFAIPSDVNMGEVVTSLIRVSSLSNIPKVYKYFDSSNEKFKHLRSIQWFGISGILDATGLNSNLIDLSFIGTEKQLQNIFQDEELFKEYPLDSDNLNSTDLAIENNINGQSLPLSLLNADVSSDNGKNIYDFKVSKAVFCQIIDILSKKDVYSSSLIDISSDHHRRAISPLFNS